MTVSRSLSKVKFIIKVHRHRMKKCSQLVESESEVKGKPVTEPWLKNIIIIIIVIIIIIIKFV